MAETVFVVLGEDGEYSDREVWVSGVFRTLDEAQQAVTERLAQRREYDAWYDRYLSVLNSRPDRHNLYKLPEYEEIKRAAEEKAGPKPPYEPAERAEVFEAEIGQWAISPEAA